MSAYRREYNARNRAKSERNAQAARQSSATPTPQPYAITAPDWDEEAIETARDQAAMLLDMDANDATALLLLQKARLAERRLRGEDVRDVTPDAAEQVPRRASRHEPFDPMQMFAQLAHYYPSFSDTAMRRMPWKRLLAYKREAERMIEEENKAVKDAQHGHGNGTQAMVDGKPVDPAYAEAQLGGYVTHAQVYDGLAVPVGA